MADRVDKAELLQTIHDEHARLEGTLAPLSEARLTQPGVTGEWAIKDLLAHITFWEQSTLAGLRAALRGERPEWPSDIDGTNARAYAEHRHQPLPAVLAERRRSFGEAVALVESLSEDDLSDGGRLARQLGVPPRLAIEENSSEHYREHGEEIRRWLDREGRAAP